MNGEHFDMLGSRRSSNIYNAALRSHRSRRGAYRQDGARRRATRSGLGELVLLKVDGAIGSDYRRASFMPMPTGTR